MTAQIAPRVVGCALTVVSSLLFGCHPKPAVVVPPPQPVVLPDPARPPAPPPPPCEALWENCVASEGTLLSIAVRGASLTPPLGWKFAKQSDRSLAVSGDGKALLTVTEIAESSDAAILESLKQLAVAAAIDKVNFEALKKRLKKPQITVDALNSKVDLWEINQSTTNRVSPVLHEQGAGTLLAFVSRVADDRVITGLAFVVVPDAEAEAERLMSAVKTLRGTP